VERLKKNLKKERRKKKRKRLKLNILYLEESLAEFTEFLWMESQKLRSQKQSSKIISALFGWEGNTPTFGGKTHAI
jgi:hypothetical protein